MTDIVERLRDRLKLRYAGDCKCGHCALVPDDLVREAADEIERLRASIDTLIRERDAERRAYNGAITGHLAEIERLQCANAALNIHTPQGLNVRRHND